MIYRFYPFVLLMIVPNIGPM